jgi:sigma-B regulation protein RsbU (phosphoserine phosphatase)
LSPYDVACAVNDLLLAVSSEDNMFVTAFYGVLHLDDRRLTYVRAGHDRPILQHAGGDAEALDGEGRFIGMFEGLPIEERTVELRSGDRLVMFSDGVPDANNAAGERYGTGRLQQLTQRHCLETAQGLADAIFTDVLSFQGDAQQFDDITLLVAALD